MDYPNISIILVNWNNAHDTLECLASLNAVDYPTYQTIVVDNASTDNSQELIMRSFPKTILLRNKENLGFAAGNNIGIQHALSNNADFILLLNNDTVVDPLILKSFIAASREYPDAGIFGAKIYQWNTNTIWYAGGRWDKRTMRFKHEGIGETDLGNKYDRIIETDFVTGCALFFKQIVPKRIGLLEPRYFFLVEDADWCQKAKNAGIRSMYVPQAKLWHKISASLGTRNTAKYTYFSIRNRLLFAQRNLPYPKRWILYIKIIKEFFRCTCDELSHEPWIMRFYRDIAQLFRDAHQRNAKFIAISDFILKRFGDCPATIKRLDKNENITPAMRT